MEQTPAFPPLNSVKGRTGRVYKNESKAIFTSLSREVARKGG